MACPAPGQAALCCWGEAAPCAQRDGQGAVLRSRKPPSVPEHAFDRLPRELLAHGRSAENSPCSAMVDNRVVLRGETTTIEGKETGETSGGDVNTPEQAARP